MLKLPQLAPLQAMSNYTSYIGIILHGSLESRVSPPEPWRYGNYYSPAAIAARASPPLAITPETTHTKQGSKAKSTVSEISGYSVGDDASDLGERGKMRGSRGSLGPLGLGGKEGRAIVMPKGCVSDEALFEAIALISMATGSAAYALRIAGRRVDGGGNLQEEAHEIYDEQLGASPSPACFFLFDSDVLSFFFSLQPFVWLWRRCSDLESTLLCACGWVRSSTRYPNYLVSFKVSTFTSRPHATADFLQPRTPP